MGRLLVLVLCAMTTLARADAPVESSDAAPWSRGVSQDRQDRARALLDQGNTQFVAKQYTEALARYREALAAWDHPAIRFNVARALLALDRPLEAAPELDAALAYGMDPLGDAFFTEAQNYKRMLGSMISTVAVECDLQATVTLDDQPVSCPRQELRVRPGRHVIAGKRDGYVTQSRTETLAPGSNPAIAIHLVSVRDATHTHTRWAVWKPWAVIGGGAALIGLGALLEWSAQGVRDDYTAAVQSECQDLACPSLGRGTLALRDSWRTRDRVGVATMIAGTGGLLGGALLLVLNRPTAVVETQRIGLDWRPSAGGGSMVVWGRF